MYLCNSHNQTMGRYVRMPWVSSAWPCQSVYTDFRSSVRRKQLPSPSGRKGKTKLINWIKWLVVISCCVTVSALSGYFLNKGKLNHDGNKLKVWSSQTVDIFDLSCSVRCSIHLDITYIDRSMENDKKQGLIGNWKRLRLLAIVPKLVANFRTILT